ncbi:MAG: prepilin-type N-terminal cleavage/methylation domain-containing protein [Acidobacteriota bacterium]|nr:prepilin-type N-terminal cleavage/methylation domain-containing protein [Acidobacteriota bacterium]
MSNEKGFSLVELLVAAAIMSMVMLAVLAVYSQARQIAVRTDAEANVHGNLRLALEMLEHDLRMAGYGVPEGVKVGAATVWTPVIFHAASDAIGFRSDIDAGGSHLTCSPQTSKPKCLLDRLSVDSVGYYDRLSCKSPDDVTQDLRLVITTPEGDWLQRDCTAVDASKGHLTVSSNLPAGTLQMGVSGVFTIEQVYYRFSALPAPEYGVISRDVRYHNDPDANFPRSGAQWDNVASSVESLTLTYFDGAGTQITGNPVPAASLPNIARVVISIGGRERIGVGLDDRRVLLRSEVLIRNR